MPSDNGQELIAGAREVILKTVEQSIRRKNRLGLIKEKSRRSERYLKKQTSKRR